MNVSIITRSGFDAEGEQKIVDSTFRECRVRGPAHLRVRNNVRIADCEFLPSEDACVLRLAMDEPYVGAIWLDDCEFEGCTFVNVKLIYPPESEVANAAG